MALRPPRDEVAMPIRLSAAGVMNVAKARSSAERRNMSLIRRE